jgi:tetratricopeptide (TPR) repeat protein
VSVEPDPLQLELERAQTLVDLQRYDEARALLTQVLAREPDEAQAWCLFAQVQIAVGDPKSGLDAAERAAALEPSDEWSHRLRSVALQQLGNKSGSIAAAREAVAAAPHAWQTNSRLAAALAFASRNPDEALAVAERAVELAPNESEARVTLGRAYEMRKDYAEAERCYKEALSLNPQSAVAHGALARRRYEASGGKLRRFGAGNLAAAATGFRDSVEADPGDPAAAANVEIVVRSFVARFSYLIYAAVWLSVLLVEHGSADLARVGPLLVIAIPVGFAVRFVGGLTPDLRRRVGYSALHGRLGLAAYAQVVAIALLALVAAAPSGARFHLAVAAFLVSLAGRLFQLARRRRGHQV